MSPFLMISNRNREDNRLDIKLAKLRFYRAPANCTAEQLKRLDTWSELSRPAFITELKRIGDTFPILPDAQNEQQQHLSLYIHGYDNAWEDTVDRYVLIKQRIIEAGGLGQLILYSWPSNGSVAGYLSDREDARSSAPDLGQLLVDLHGYLLDKQRVAVETGDPSKFCRAKISIIAHSMGNFVLQKALAMAAKRLNSPQLVALINQLIMVAADVDNDIFQTNKAQDSDGCLMANLCYRIGALYTGLDAVLGMSAGLKHFGTRRLGRSGLSDGFNVWDNVFDLDISDFIRRDIEVHSAAFESPQVQTILQRMLRGVDRAFVTQGL